MRLFEINNGPDLDMIMSIFGSIEYEKESDTEIKVNRDSIVAFYPALTEVEAYEAFLKDVNDLLDGYRLMPAGKNDDYHWYKSSKFVNASNASVEH